MFLQQVRNKILNSSGRSKEAVKNIVLSLVGKAVSVISSLLIVPLTIDYINPTQYGIWLTLSSIIVWITFFDLGLGNGFRNKFSEARAKGDDELARQYLSTTYFAITSVIAVVFLVVLIGNRFIDWSSVLNIDNTYREELSSVFLILAIFFCISMVANLVGTMLTADQKVGLSSILFGIGQFASLIAVYILTKISVGSLTNLALYFSGMPSFVWVVASIIVFRNKKYCNIKPSFSSVRISLVKNIMGLGLQFFAIYLSMIIIFQMINIVISREMGPDAVTEYNIAYKYFNSLSNVFIIVLTPFWSGFTDAYQKGDFVWMKKMLKYLERLWVVFLLLYFVMLLCSQEFYLLWIGSNVSVNVTTSIIVAFHFVFYSLGGVYMYLINGIGTIRIQLIIYILFAVVAWPLMVFLGRIWGLLGIVFVPTFTLLIQAIFGKIQLEKLLNKNADGIWNK